MTGQDYKSGSAYGAVTAVTDSGDTKSIRATPAFVVSNGAGAAASYSMSTRYMLNGDYSTTTFSGTYSSTVVTNPFSTPSMQVLSVLDFTGATITTPNLTVQLPFDTTAAFAANVAGMVFEFVVLMKISSANGGLPRYLTFAQQSNSATLVSITGAPYNSNVSTTAIDMGLTTSAYRIKVYFNGTKWIYHSTEIANIVNNFTQAISFTGTVNLAFTIVDLARYAYFLDLSSTSGCTFLNITMPFTSSVSPASIYNGYSFKVWFNAYSTLNVIIYEPGGSAITPVGVGGIASTTAKNTAAIYTFYNGGWYVSFG